MQHISSLVSNSNFSQGGGRSGSDLYRQSLKQCENFTGLEDDINRYELLQLVRRAGKTAGFTHRMIQLLEIYLVRFTRDQDWEEGSRPIVYQSLARTALQMDISERQIQNLEKQLFELGAITWHSSGNNKRYGSRDPETERIVFAYGVDLTPLAYLRYELERKIQDKQIYEQAWITTRREISAWRAQIRSLLLEMRGQSATLQAFQACEEDYGKIAYQLRTHIKLDDMRSLLEEHKSLYSRLLGYLEVNSPESEQVAEEANIAETTQKTSSRSEKTFAHYKYNNPHKKINRGSPTDIARQKSVVEPVELHVEVMEGELRQINLKQILLASSDRFRAYLPLEPRLMNWGDVHEAAFQLRADMFISQRSWKEACQVLGRTDASLSIIVTDRGRDRTENPVVRPAAYFRGMINKARAGELNLQKSIFGLLEIGS